MKTPSKTTENNNIPKEKLNQIVLEIEASVFVAISEAFKRIREGFQV